MKVSWDKALELVLKYLTPSLIFLAEGVKWGEKRGEEKSTFVKGILKFFVGIFAAESTGGQKDTWDRIEEPLNQTIDGLVNVANEAGVFKRSGPAVSPNP